MKLNLITNRKGTALLVAMLVMGVLMTISLALSTLIFRETRITKDFIDAGQSYYSAESGIEMALYSLNNKLPGWQPGSAETYTSYFVDPDLKTVGELRVENRCKAYPCFDEDEFDYKSASAKEFYDYLDLNETITLPLFVVKNGEIVNATDFVVEYYVAFDASADLNNLQLKTLSGWDVLRWKLFGVRNENAAGGGAGITEAISDFTAVSVSNTHDFQTNAQRPSWFGSESCELLNDQQKNSRYNKDIQCLPFTASLCDTRTARETYLYNYSIDGAERELDGKPVPCYPIGNFLGEHKLNYLTLTNFINPTVLKEPGNEMFQRLYFRVELFTETGAAETAREYADITANGYSGDSKQSINVKIKKDSFMPVFNFSLYSTYISGKSVNGEIHNEEYWYGKEEEGLPTL